MRGTDDRGQAYTLESLIAAVLLLTAVLFALQSVVITPTSSGGLDRDAQTQIEQEAADALSTAAETGELSSLARYWACVDNDGDGRGDFADQPDGAGLWVSSQGYSNNSIPVAHLDEVLNSTYGSGTRYNVQLIYENNSRQNVSRIVHRGSPGPEVVTSSHTIALTEDQLITSPSPTDSSPTPSGELTIGSPDCDEPAIPDEYPSSSLYNVVEVRLVIW